MVMLLIAGLISHSNNLTVSNYIKLLVKDEISEMGI